MRRRVQSNDGLQDVMSQVGQVDDGISHHCFDVGCARHQEWKGGLLTTRGNRCLNGVLLKMGQKETDILKYRFRHCVMYARRTNA